jgi:membrane protease YdiL (CAAX protease family)
MWRMGVAGGAAGEQKGALGAQGERLGASTPLPGVLGRWRSVLGVAAAYACMGAAGAGIAVALGLDPVACDGWLGMGGAASALSSLGMGVCVATAAIAATRTLAGRAGWARALHAALRPAVEGAGDASLFAVAIASGVGEELLFRGLLVQVVGVLAASLLFGVLHQVRGSARWGWMALATGIGLVFAVIFRATGSLLGPIAAHALINGANLRYLRDRDPEPPRRPLGGLLRG